MRRHTIVPRSRENAEIQLAYLKGVSGLRLLRLARERLEAEDADGALGLTLAAMKVGA